MIREYKVSFGYLKKYATKIGKQIDFKDIDLKFYEGFTQYLQDEKLAVNTIGKKIQTLKIFLNSAKDEGLNKYDSYKSSKFKALTEEAETIALDEEELTKLYEKDFSDRPSLERVRDLFLVGCWTGCRFSDITQITPENISGGFIHIKQHKTGAKVVIPLHPVVTAILNKYDGQLPEPISNQKFNLALKEIAEIAEINDSVHKAITKGGNRVSKAYKKYELVTTHTARRSFATNLYKSGFPSLSIMAITGHKTEEAFLKYIKVTSEEHAIKLQEHWNKSYLKVV
jgi:integrase